MKYFIYSILILLTAALLWIAYIFWANRRKSPYVNKDKGGDGGGSGGDSGGGFFSSSCISGEGACGGGDGGGGGD